jgi:hypothetical protein
MPTNKDRDAFTKDRATPVAKDATNDKDEAKDTKAKAADKQADKAADAKFQDSDFSSEPHTLVATSAEEAATTDAMADRLEDGVLHIPTSPEEHTEIANKEQAQINEDLGLNAEAEDDDSTPLTGGPPARRILAYDGPLNLKDRNSGWNVDHMDTVSDDPTLKGPTG